MLLGHIQTLLPSVVDMRTIALDFDGTLLDSRLRHSHVLKDILDDLGYSYDVSDLVVYKSNGKNNKDYLLEKGIDREAVDLIQKMWIDRIENETYLKDDILYEDTISFLESLSVNNKLILITARANKKGLKDQLNSLGLTYFFQKIIIVETGISAIEGKALQLLENNVNLMIGDTEVDMEACLKAKVKFIALNRGFRSSSFWNRRCVDSCNALNLDLVENG